MAFSLLGKVIVIELHSFVWFGPHKSVTWLLHRGLDLPQKVFNENRVPLRDGKWAEWGYMIQEHNLHRKTAHRQVGSTLLLSL
jgi:hypothetical protein